MIFLSSFIRYFSFYQMPTLAFVLYFASTFFLYLMICFFFQPVYLLSSFKIIFTFTHAFINLYHDHVTYSLKLKRSRKNGRIEIFKKVLTLHSQNTRARFVPSWLRFYFILFHLSLMYQIFVLFGFH